MPVEFVNDMHSSTRPLVSVIFPVYNEEALLREHISEVCAYTDSLADRFEFEILIVNDGSRDSTGQIADELAKEFEMVKVLHHPTNFGVGQALKFGIANTSGDYVVTMDVDLSYDVQHIDQLVDKMRDSHAKIVLASPYMKGGSISNVPTVRRVMSILGNRFLRFFSSSNASTITSMVRAYDGRFVRAMDYRSTGLDLMPETLYKAMVVRAEIAEMPARLDWGPQLKYGENRTSSMRLLKHVFSTIMSGFLFRPMFFFIIPGLLIGAFAIYADFLMFGHFFDALKEVRAEDENAPIGRALKRAYAFAPHAFVFSMLSTMMAIQLLGLGVISMQNKRNYEELYYLNATKLHALKESVESKRNDK